ncbi:MAG: CBS domain-containing protein [Bdellovibrionota bacterium]
MKVKECMTDQPVLCGSLDSLFECSKLMYQKNVGYLLVIDGDDKFVGVITDRDIVCGCIAQGFDPQSTPVTEVMERRFFTLKPDQTIDEALRVMSENGIRRLPVIDENRCVGILSVDDLIVKEACETKDIAPIFKRQLSEPRLTRSTVGEAA